MKRLGKILFTIGLLCILIGVVVLKQDSIMTIFNTYLFPNNEKVKIETKNEYYRDYDFMFVKNVDTIDPNNYNDLLDTYYSIINAGYKEFTFYCPKEYEKCLNDVELIANNQILLSNINNYTHPYNAFSHIETEFDSLGKVTIKIERSYTDNEIEMINEKVDEIYEKIYDSRLSVESNIKNIYDYIVNTTKYDSLRSDKNIIEYKSDTAYGPLFEGYAVCGGYTDLMQLFLEKMNLKSYRVSSSKHIWNAVEINNKWYHIDLTWDDPVADDGKDYLSHEYLLIDTKKLLDMEKLNIDLIKIHLKN